MKPTYKKSLVLVLILGNINYNLEKNIVVKYHI